VPYRGTEAAGQPFEGLESRVSRLKTRPDLRASRSQVASAFGAVHGQVAFRQMGLQFLHPQLGRL